MSRTRPLARESRRLVPDLQLFLPGQAIILVIDYRVVLYYKRKRPGTHKLFRETVAKAIKQVNPGKSQGPDMIHPKLVKEVQSNIIGPLVYIYQSYSMKVLSLPCGNKQTSQQFSRLVIEKKQTAINP